MRAVHPERGEGTVVYTAKYRLMFSYREQGNGGEMEGDIEPKDGENVRRREKQDEGIGLFKDWE